MVPLAAAGAVLPARVAAHVGARLDPGNGEARRWLEEELSRPAYREHNDPIARLLAAIERFIDNLLNADPSAGGALPAGVAGLITAALVALVLFALRHVRREARRSDVGGPALLGEERLTAEQFRERSRRALDEGRFAEAVLDAMRAIAQGAAERTLLDDAPSLTAHEVGLQLADPFPAHRAELAGAADLFDAVAYGHHAPERAQAEGLLALEATLRRTRPQTRQPVGAGAGAGQGDRPAGGAS